MSQTDLNNCPEHQAALQKIKDHERALQLFFDLDCYQKDVLIKWLGLSIMCVQVHPIFKEWHEAEEAFDMLQFFYNGTCDLLNYMERSSAA